MEVVLPGDPDAAVELDAVLDQLGGVGPDPHLGGADHLAGVGGIVGHGPRRRSGHGVAGLQVELVVGHPVLEGLVARQGATEREPVPQVLDGHGEHPVHHPGHLVALQGAGDLEAPLHLVVGAAERTDDGVGSDGDAVEADLGEPADQVEAAQGGDGDPGGVGGDQDLAAAPVVVDGHQQVAGLGPGLDRGGDAVEHQAVAVGAPGDAPVAAPGGHGLAAEQPGQHLGSLGVAARPTQGGGHDVDRDEGAGGDEAPHLLGHEHQVGQPVVGEAAAAVGLGHEQRGPAQLGPAPPHVRVEAGGVVLEGPHGGDGALGGQEAPGRLDEERLVLAQLQLHLASRSAPASPARGRSVW